MIETYGEYCELCDELKKLAKAYDEGNALVDDSVYDAKYRELKAYELQNPDLKLDDSPTNRVYGSNTDGFRKVEHKIPMGSITNANGIEEAVDWVRMVRDKYGAKKFELEYKLDGASLSLIYKDGTLVDAVTRGQNNVGDAIPENAVRMQGVKTCIKRKGDVEIRGEGLWFFEQFDAYNEQLEQFGKPPISNPRNGVAGTLKLKSPDEVEQRKVNFVAYIVAQGSESDTQTGDVEYLESEGFEVPPHETVDVTGDEGLERFREVAERMRENRYNMPYAIDGVVIKVDDKELQDRMGYPSSAPNVYKAPNYYKAYKFLPEEKDTELIDIENSIGKSGAITPVAVFKPVNLAMTVVQRCSLHNWDLVEYLGLFKGCTVRIRKAGEIIPELVKCVETGVSKDDYDILVNERHEKPRVYAEMPYSKRLITNKEFYRRPEKCPFCGSVLWHDVNDKDEELVAWVCKNPECPAQMVEKLCHFVDRKVMNIRGLGESSIQQLFDSGKVRTFDDLYRLKKEDIEQASDRHGKKSRALQSAKILEAIENSKGNFLHQWIEGFGITGLGHTAAPLVAECVHRCGGMKKFIANPTFSTTATEFRQYADTLGVSAMIADAFLDFVVNQQVVLSNLVFAGVTFPHKENKVVSASLAGRVCIMTGVFDKLGRNEFKELVVTNGGTVCSGISKKTNLVLMGDGAGPSKVKAIEDLKSAGYKIDVYTPATLSDFMNMVEGKHEETDQEE